MLGFEKCDSHSLSLLFWRRQHLPLLLLPYVCVCMFPFLSWILKRKTFWSQGAPQEVLRLPVLSEPYGSPFPPHSLIEDLSMCHAAFSLPGPADANVAEISDFPLTPLQSLLESFTQTKQQQAAGSNLSPEYRKTCSGITHVCNRIHMRARVCFVFGLVFILVFV